MSMASRLHHFFSHDAKLMQHFWQPLHASCIMCFLAIWSKKCCMMTFCNIVPNAHCVCCFLHSQVTCTSLVNATNKNHVNTQYTSRPDQFSVGIFGPTT